MAYTLPTAHFAGTFAKTRIDPIIQGSKELREAIHKTNDNNEVKQFGDSFLYIRGAASSNAPISIPCDHLIHDEVDFCDQEVLGQYFSRLTHSAWKRTTRVSTPTLPGFGISKSFDESRRYYNLCCCNHCNHWFQPDYYRHVQIPGYFGDLRSINKHSLTRIRWKEAVLACPKCGETPSLQKEHRQFVCENPDENYDGAGYQITPFDAPNIIKISDLILASTKYDRRQDFDNFNLGIPAEDSEATLTRDDFKGMFVHMDPPTGCAYVMGIDVGSVYHFVVAAIDPWDDMMVVTKLQVPMGEARKTYVDLRQRFRVICTVIDSAPHAETVMALQSLDPNCYAAVYTRTKSILTHVVLDKEQDAEKGKEFVRQVNINRNRALDAYMLYVREGHMRSIASEDDELVISHHMSMKRVKTYENDSGEMSYTWQKTDGIDHYHHAHLYCWMAGKIKGVGRSLITLPISTVMKFPLKERVT